MPRPSISLHLIAKNESHNLPVLFESIKGCFDEVYLTDTGSTDNTVELAKKHGAIVSHFDWIEDFSAARNFSFEQGNTDYQMWLDCDDSLMNQEHFKLWRDEVMHLSDYHVATYHYANDGKGNPTCSFIRERVVKRGKGFKWSYFLHEGIKPEAKTPIRADVATTWSIWHRRTEQDLQADRSRNLSMFRGRERDLDPRMKFYYGKELFEGGMWDAAVEWLAKATKHMGLEPHDRILAHQYMGYALSSLAARQYDFAGKYKDNQYLEKAQTYFAESIGVSMQGIQLDPNRAEFYVNVADCYIKQNKFAQAIPFLKGAMACGVNSSNGALFSVADHYSYYPRLQLTRCLAQIGKIAESKKEAEELVRLHPTDEAKSVLNELNSISKLDTITINAQPCDDIIISCPPNGAMLWDGKIYRESFCGGSETAAIEMAENWVKLGKTVKVFQPRESRFEYNGVEYLPVQQMHEYLKHNKPWLHVAWRHNVKLTDAFTILWCHDLFTPDSNNSNNYDYHACLTPFHKRYTMAKMGVPESKIWVTRNGLNPDKFKLDPVERDPFRFVFSSSPDRGLDRCIRVLDRVREKYPQVKLHIFYGWDHLHKYGLHALQAQLQEMYESRKDWIVYHGKTEQKVMMQEFYKSSYCVQPSDWVETSKITALELACCGVYQITRAIGGCVDTTREIADAGMASIVDSECITESEYQVYINETIAALDEQRQKRVNVDPNKYSWEGVAKEWLEFTERNTK